MGEQFLQPRQQIVDRNRQALQFIGGRRHRNAATQVLGAHNALRRLCNFINRAKCSARQPRAAARRRQQHHHAADCQRIEEELQRIANFRHRPCDLQHADNLFATCDRIEIPKRRH